MVRTTETLDCQSSTDSALVATASIVFASTESASIVFVGFAMFASPELVTFLVLATVALVAFAVEVTANEPVSSQSAVMVHVELEVNACSIHWKQVEGNWTMTVELETFVAVAFELVAVLVDEVVVVAAAAFVAVVVAAELVAAFVAFAVDGSSFEVVAGWTTFDRKRSYWAAYR